MSLITMLDEEISNISRILRSVPFSEDQPSSVFFLNIYRLDFASIGRLRDQPEKFPVEPAKLLKLGISLGSLVKMLELDEQLLANQQQQQSTASNGRKPASNSMGVGGLKKLQSHEPSEADRPKPLSPSNPTMRVISSSSTASAGQPFYHAKFARNLLTVLKNFDIGSQVSSSRAPPESSSATLNGSMPATPTSNVSPIKLNSKQLLIEKLEINIPLDNMFIYKTLLKITLQIFQLIRRHLNGLNLDLTSSAVSLSRSSTVTDFDENSSIFSMGSTASNDSNVSITAEEYVRVVKQIVHRILIGLIEPFTKLIFTELVESDVQSQFSKLLNSL